MSFTFAAAVLSAVLALLCTGASAQSTCNGHAELCSRLYSNVTYVGAHNSYAVDSGNIAANQNYTVTTQLDNGIRLLQVQGHMNGNELHLCHTSCALLDAGTFADYLSEVKTWLDSNPNEVITILMVNSDGIAPSVWGQAYTDSGLDADVYTPPYVPLGYYEWPTLGELISSGTRVVNFLAQNADVSSVGYLLDEFTHVWETPYNEEDPSFPCTVDRVTGDYQGKMYLNNHYLDTSETVLGISFAVPATSELNTTNAASGGAQTLGGQAETCYASYGYYPTFTLVDYYDMPPEGGVFEYAASVNGVSYTAVQVGDGGSGSSSSSSSNTTGAASAIRVSWTALFSAVALVAAVALRS